MNERNILASVLRSREAYERIANHVADGDLTDQGRIIYDAIERYYNNDPACSSADPALIAESVGRRVAGDKHREVFSGLVSQLSEHECSPANIVEDFIEHRKHVAGNQLATALLAGDQAGIQAALDSYIGVADLDLSGGDADSTIVAGQSLTELFGETFDTANLIKVYPESLNRRLDGGLKRGHHLVIFARPEMGKTMTVVNMMGGFAQDGRKVLYIGNEDPIADVAMRLTNRLTGLTKFDVLRDLELADQLARERGYENIVMVPLAPGTPREITALLEKYEPDVLVLDQLRNLNMNSDHFTQSLEKAATQARNWAKRYNCVVVSVTQAGDSASGKSILDLGDCDSSNTGIPAQADVMLGIGATDQHVARSELVFSLPKNKVSGKHEYFSVQAHPTVSKLTSLE